MLKIANRTKVGKRLTRARGKLSASSLARELQIEPSQVTRWEDGKMPEACIQVAQLGAMVGLDPNDLFLDDAHLTSEAGFGAQKAARLNVLVKEIVRFAQNTDDEGQCLQELSSFLAALDRKWNTGLPVGTIISSPRPGVGAAEPQAPYSKKKRKE